MRISRGIRIVATTAAGIAAAALAVSPANAAIYGLNATIEHGNSAIAATSGNAQPGLWTYTARVQGHPTDLWLQLYHASSTNHCFDKSGQIASYDFVNPGSTVSWTAHSPYSGLHCVRVVLWGSVGDAAQVTVTDPAGSLN